jgi:hypothetical protein
MKNAWLILSVVSLPALSASVASAHIRVDSPAPRWTQNPKPPSCGAAARTDPEERGPRHTFQAGETITIEWTETVQHPGFYRIAFSEDGDDFVNPVDQSDNTMYPGVLVQDIEDKNTSGATYSQSVTLPNINCDNCTLQVIQVMTEGSKAPTESNPTNHLYFQCVDLELEGAPDGAGGAGGAGDDPDPSTGGTTGSGGSGAQATGGTTASSGSGGAPETAPGGNSNMSNGTTFSSDSGCSVVSRRHHNPAVPAFGFLGLAVFLAHRRRSAARDRAS